MNTDFGKWLLFGTGVGIEIHPDSLGIAAVRIRPSGTAVLGAASVTDYAARPAGEWGTELLQFLKSIGAAHITANVLLPRHEVIVRQISLPGVTQSDLEGAVSLQMETLHPFEAEDVYYSWSKIPKTGEVLIGIARREVVDRYAALFAEAGIKIAAFTFSAAILYDACRLLAAPPSDEGFVSVRPAADGEWEVYGESPAKPIFSALLPGSQEGAVIHAVGQLRIDPATSPVPTESLLPKPTIFPQSFDPETPAFGDNALLYAAATVAACRWLGKGVANSANLLPPDLRRGSSRLRLIPTAVLSSALLLLAGGLALQGHYEDGRYLGLLQHEIRRWDPQARQVDTIDKQMGVYRARSQAIDDFRRRTRLDMEALSEVTRLIAPPGWVNGLELEREIVQFGGEVEAAAALLKALDSSPYFIRSEFTMPITRQGNGEAFRVRVARRAPAAGAGK